MGWMVDNQIKAKPKIDSVRNNMVIDNQMIWKLQQQQHPNLIASYDVRNHGTGYTQFLDSSGNNNHASMSGFSATSWLSDGSLKFNGVNTFITTPLNQNIFNGSNGATYEFIVKLGTATSYRGLFGDHTTSVDGVACQWDSTNLCTYFASRGFRLDVASSILGTGYIHLSFTYERTQFTILLNGEPVAVRNDTNNSPNRPIIVGRSQAASDRYMGGNLKLANFYNKALTQSELLANYNRFVKEGLVA